MEKEQSNNKNEKSNINDNSKSKENLKESKNEDINNDDQENLNENKINEDINKDYQENLSPEKEIESLKDKLARTFAELENQRRRFEKEKEDAFEYGGFGFAKEALNLLDNLERSKISLENDESLKNSETLKKVLEHFEIINKDMLSIFKKNKIEPIKSINEKLDPNLHQALIEIEDDSKEPGSIVQEIQIGFLMKDRLLRPSLVGVSKNKNDTKTEKATKDEENSLKKTEN